MKCREYYENIHRKQSIHLETDDTVSDHQCHRNYVVLHPCDRAMWRKNYRLTNLSDTFYYDNVLGSSLHIVCNIFSSIRERRSPEYVVRSETFTAEFDAVKVSFFGGG